MAIKKAMGTDAESIKKMTDTEIAEAVRRGIDAVGRGIGQTEDNDSDEGIEVPEGALKAMKNIFADEDDSSEDETSGGEPEDEAEDEGKEEPSEEVGDGEVAAAEDGDGDNDGGELESLSGAGGVLGAIVGGIGGIVIGGILGTALFDD